MAAHWKAHPEDEILELYAMGRLEEPALGKLEEHLLLCGSCQERLDVETEYIGVMREATERTAEEPEAAAEPAWKRWLRLEWMPLPIPALAGAMAVVVAVLVWQPWSAPQPVEWRTVELATLRGDANAARAREGFALHLRLDVTGIETTGAAAQIVTSTGTIVSEMPVAMEDGKAAARFAGRLEAGQYWVRLKKNGETVREYSLQVTGR